MDNIASKVGDFSLDLEIGGVTIESGSVRDFSSGVDKMRLLYSEDHSGFGSCKGSTRDEERVISCVASECGDQLMVGRKEGDEKGVDVSKKIFKEKPKAMSAEKPPRPPRPPRGLSLDSADQKLIKELAEIAKLKRARIDRMKALKKMKESKGISSKNQYFAAMFTIIFCLVLLFQGMSSKTSSSSSYQGSPMSSAATPGDLLSIKHYPNLSLVNADRPDSESPSLAEQVSGFKPRADKLGRAVG